MATVALSGIITPSNVVTATSTTTLSNKTLATPTITGVTTFSAGTAALPALTTSGDTNTGIFFPAADTIAFSEGGAESVRIDSSGNLMVGTTSNTIGSDNGLLALKRATSGYSLVCSSAQTGSVSYMIKFTYDNTTSTGQISTTNTTVSYATSSDYRLKNTIAPMTGALAKVARLKPVTYKWNIDGSNGEGFIAHELAEICPEAVTGEKDAVQTYLDDEGNEQTRPTYQGIDVSFLVATLTAAIQEQQTMIESLKARLDAANL